MRRLRSILAMVSLIVPWAIPVHAAASAPVCDFNGDSYSDLAIGSPGVSEVNIVDGSPAGLTAAGDQLLLADDLGLATGSGMGAALACGDFNGDGRDDLAMGASVADDAGSQDAGAVAVAYGSNGGLTENRLPFQVIHRSIPGVNGGSAYQEQFGRSVAAGDFDGDGYDDLAIGIPGALVGGESKAGAVYVTYGSSNGLTSDGDQVWHRNKPGVPGGVDYGDQLGETLATGDFDGDGYDDLVLGAPYGQVQGLRSGFVNVLYGSAAGITSKSSDYWYRGAPGIKGKHESGDWSFNVATGDFDDDGFDDLAVSDRGDKISGVDGAGSINVIFGGVNGLKKSGDVFIHRGTKGVKGGLTPAQFGDALIAGDFNGNGKSDLAVGAPRDSSEKTYGGVVHVLNGRTDGLSGKGDQTWSQSSPGVPGGTQALDRFGDTLGVGDFDGDGFTDIAIGVTWEDAGGESNSGRVVALYGTSDKLSANGSQSWSRASQGIKGAPSCTGFPVLQNFWNFSAAC